MVGHLYQNLLDYWDNVGISWTGPSSCVYMGSTWTQRFVNDPAQPGLKRFSGVEFPAAKVDHRFSISALVRREW